MPRPFNFSEFADKTVSVKTRTQTRQANGTYTSSFAVTSSVTASKQPVDGGRIQLAGGDVKFADWVLYVFDSVTIPANSIATLDGTDYEIVHNEAFESQIGSYTAIYIKDQQD